jgi:hypothetical protein
MKHCNDIITEKQWTDLVEGMQKNNEGTSLEFQYRDDVISYCLKKDKTESDRQQQYLYDKLLESVNERKTCSFSGASDVKLPKVRSS